MDIARDTTQDTLDSDGTTVGAGPADGPVDPEVNLDRYANEFANLVRQYPPSRTDVPSDWLGRLPDEIYAYFRHGIATFGGSAQTPAQRRGRLYLLHTALVLMWIEWGKHGVRERLETQAREGARRAAYLTTLEAYRRGGVLADYEASGWFTALVGEWPVTLVSAAVETAAIEDAGLRAALEQDPVVRTDMDALSVLRDAGAIPERTDLAFAEEE